MPLLVFVLVYTPPQPCQLLSFISQICLSIASKFPVHSAVMIGIYIRIYLLKWAHHEANICLGDNKKFPAEKPSMFVKISSLIMLK